MMLADMDDQFKVKPQTGSHYFVDRKSNRDPLANTVPRDGHVYPFAPGDVDKAEVAFAAGNPVPNSEFVLARGQNRFSHTFCAPCHNYGGTGDGLVQTRSGFGATETMNITREIARGYSDAKLFHIISVGQNIMPAYGDRLSDVDRWAVVRYIRELQGKAAGVSPASTAAPVDSSATTTAGGK